MTFALPQFLESFWNRNHVIKSFHWAGS